MKPLSKIQLGIALSISLIVSAPASAQLREYSEENRPMNFEQADMFYKVADQPIRAQDLNSYFLRRREEERLFACKANTDVFRCKSGYYEYEMDEVLSLILKDGGLLNEIYCEPLFLSPEFKNDPRFSKFSSKYLAAPALVKSEQLKSIYKIDAENEFIPNDEQKKVLSQGLVFDGSPRPTIYELLDFTSFLRSDYTEGTREFSVTVGKNNNHIYKDIGADIRTTYRKKENMLIANLMANSDLGFRIVGYSLCQKKPKTQFYCYAYGDSKTAYGNLLSTGESLQTAKSNLKYDLDQYGLNFLENKMRCSKNVRDLDLQVSIFHHKNFGMNDISFVPISKIKIW